MKRWLITLVMVAGCSTPSQFVQQASEHDNDDCTLTQGFWKNHETQWPVSALTLGDEDYTQAQLLELLHLPTAGDASLILGHQLIAALLNVEHGAVAGPSTQAALHDAQDWMVAHADADGRLPYGVDGTAAHTSATVLSEALDAFNNGASGSNHCEDPDPTPEPTTDGGDDDDDDDFTISTEPFNTPTPSGDLD